MAKVWTYERIFHENTYQRLQLEMRYSDTPLYHFNKFFHQKFSKYDPKASWLWIFKKESIKQSKSNFGNSFGIINQLKYTLKETIRQQNFKTRIQLTKQKHLLFRPGTETILRIGSSCKNVRAVLEASLNLALSNPIPILEGAIRCSQTFILISVSASWTHTGC